MIKALGHSFKQAFVQFFRNRGMTLASLISITAMLIILGMFFFLSVNVSFLTESIKSQFDTIEVYLLDDTTSDQAKVMIESLNAMDEVESVQLITKDMAMDEFKERWGENAYLLDGLGENPLPNSLRITLTDIEGGDMTAAICRTFTGVEDVRYYKDEIDRIIKISDTIQRGALIVIAFLIVVSIVVVSNTIKITVMSRRSEIEIMKYVGATNWFIRGPMLLEGMIIGVVAAACALGICAALYIRFCESFGEQVNVMFSTDLVEPHFLIVNLIAIFMSLGVSIGAVGSIISMRRFLKA